MVCLKFKPLAILYCKYVEALAKALFLVLCLANKFASGPTLPVVARDNVDPSLPSKVVTGRPVSSSIHNLLVSSGSLKKVPSKARE